MFDDILTGPISGVSAGQYIVGLINETSDYIKLGLHVSPNFGAAFFAILCTVYFWWYNIKGVHESSAKSDAHHAADDCDGRDLDRLVHLYRPIAPSRLAAFSNT